MPIEHETPVDTSEGSTDDRVGPDGKITRKHGEALKAKAINNIAESLIGRADALGGEARLEDGKHFNTYGRTVHGKSGAEDYELTGLSAGRIDPESGKSKDTFVAVRQHENPDRNMTILSSTTHDDEVRSAYVKHVDSSDELGGDIRGSGSSRQLDSEWIENRSKATKTAIDVIKEQRAVLSAAKRVVESKDDQEEKAA